MAPPGEKFTLAAAPSATETRAAALLFPLVLLDAVPLAIVAASSKAVKRLTFLGVVTAATAVFVEESRGVIVVVTVVVVSLLPLPVEAPRPPLLTLVPLLLAYQVVPGGACGILLSAGIATVTGFALLLPSFVLSFLSVVLAVNTFTAEWFMLRRRGHRLAFLFCQRRRLLLLVLLLLLLLFLLRKRRCDE